MPKFTSNNYLGKYAKHNTNGKNLIILLVLIVFGLIVSFPVQARSVWNLNHWVNVYAPGDNGLRTIPQNVSR